LIEKRLSFIDFHTIATGLSTVTPGKELAMRKSTFTRLALAALVALSSLVFGIEGSMAAPMYTVQYETYAGRTQLAAMNLSATYLLKIVNGEPVMYTPAATTDISLPAGTGQVGIGTFSSPDQQWKVATVHATQAMQSLFRAAVENTQDGQTRIFEPNSNLSYANSMVFAVNNSGFAVGTETGTLGPYGDATRFNPDGTATSLGVEGWAFAINNTGEIVGIAKDGWSTNGRLISHAFLFDAGTMYDLNQLVSPDLGLKLVSATAISDNGLIAAYGVDSSGYDHELLLTPDPNGSLPVVSDPVGTTPPVGTEPPPVPEPSTALIFGVIAGAGLLWSRREGANVATSKVA
jgi:probable HAF family extracellular repeat protein